MKSVFHRAVVLCASVAFAGCATTTPLHPPLNRYLGEEVVVTCTDGTRREGMLVKSDTLGLTILMDRPTDDRFVFLYADSIAAVHSQPRGGITALGSIEALAVTCLVASLALWAFLAPLR